MASVSVPRVSDRSLLNFFIDETLMKYKELGLSDSSTCSVSLGGFTINVDAKGSCAQPDTLEELYSNKQVASSITRITINGQSLSGCTIYYERSTDSFIDQLAVTQDPNRRVNELSSRIFRHLNNLLIKGAEPCFGGGANNALEVASAHHEVLTRLEGLSAELIEKQVKQVQDLERDKQKFLDDRGADFAKKVNDQDEAYSKKVAELDEQYKLRSQELDDWQQRIDDADNTSTRRKTTTRTLDEAQVKARGFNFSTNVTDRSKKAVQFAMALVAIGVLGLAFSLYELWTIHNIEISTRTSLINAMLDGKIKESTAIEAPTTQLTYFLFFRILASSALVVSSIVYLIRWHNSWADRIAQQELDNQIFIRDLNRAQLAVEMSLEWNEKKDGEIPHRLLESLTEGLFKPKEATNKELLHPAEQIAAALLKTADKVTLPLGGSTVETTGKKLRKTRAVSPVPEKKAG
ncbi:hypothetical protein [Vibrio parahaemolyticus]|uniref:hypothetical protein n=1 Tax=Vibrio parahaemolyticus TaxID=670 RepID=UPI00235F6D3D|nr:hypothetical protein [Vibrio parahaemolyticus]MDF4441355.1 hypothetical protein [Vibrio parahaemolyticus]HCG7925593.1 hypothetical protein [Vibrio parahaemolyticus]HCH0781503.1 hypothetical protein [Vibrio parahaemolyticus]